MVVLDSADAALRVAYHRIVCDTVQQMYEAGGADSVDDLIELEYRWRDKL